jgi:hypothetical protein
LEKLFFGRSVFCLSRSWFKSTSAEYQGDNCTFSFHVTEALLKHVFESVILHHQFMEKQLSRKSTFGTSCFGTEGSDSSLVFLLHSSVLELWL